MSDSSTLLIYTDGAARGNPGPAAFAYVIRRDGAPEIEANGLLGEATNNVAEYTAVVRALEHAQKLGARRVEIRSDSELLVNQMNGKYQVKNEGLRPLYEEARRLRSGFESVTFRHVRRGDNAHADRLCNEALDGGPAARPAAAPKAKKAAPPAAHLQDRVRDEALSCLRAVAAAWARGDANHPRPEDVWDQLWDLLEEAGVLRAARPR